MRSISACAAPAAELLIIQEVDVGFGMTFVYEKKPSCRQLADRRNFIPAGIMHAAKSIQETFVAILELQSKLIIAERKTQPSAAKG